jgi:putative zinc finger/helix-turn-helix YgiT family protein
MRDEGAVETDRKEKAYPRRCGSCGASAVVRKHMRYAAEVKHDGKLHRFRVARLGYDKCRQCGEEFFTSRTDEQITSALREHLGLLQPEEIRQRLVELGFSQRAFAERLGVAAESVSRWLNGVAVQTRAMDNLMRVFLEFDEVREALATGGPAKTLGVRRGDTN